MSGRGKLIAVIGDEDTCTGFLLGGVGELNKNRKPNFLVVEKDTSITEIEETFKYVFMIISCVGCFCLYPYTYIFTTVCFYLQDVFAQSSDNLVMEFEQPSD